ncbi:hypothetical protein WP50_09200 [Lactiplantibacillus plantarum]|nr:hypothetical protein WP50_09200 [Lactiplantibacillus plantarum]
MAEYNKHHVGLTVKVSASKISDSISLTLMIGFIRDYATDDDLTELLTLISDRHNFLHKKIKDNNK